MFITNKKPEKLEGYFWKPKKKSGWEGPLGWGVIIGFILYVLIVGHQLHP